MDRIDPSDTLEAVGNDKTLLSELFSIFIDQYPSDILKIKDALKQKDAMLAHKLLHKMKGSLGILGAKQAYALTAEMDSLSKENSLSHVIDLLPTLDEELAYIKTYYETFLIQ